MQLNLTFLRHGIQTSMPTGLVNRLDFRRMTMVRYRYACVTLAFPYQLNSPTRALIDLKVRGRLDLFIPVWGWRNTLTGLRIGTVPQRRLACRCDARRLCLYPDVVQYWRMSALCVMNAMIRICQPLTRKRRARSSASAAPSPRCNAIAGVHREAAVAVS